MSDPFAEVFSSDGFAETYKRKLAGPASRREIEAEREAHAATKNPLAVLGLTPAADATQPPAEVTAAEKADRREHFRNIFASMTPEGRAEAEEALLDVSISKDEIPTFSDNSDDWED